MPTKRTVSQARYDKDNTRRYGFKLNLKTDADIIAKLNAQPSIQSYVKSLIRADIAANGGTQEVDPTCPSSSD